MDDEHEAAALHKAQLQSLEDSYPAATRLLRNFSIEATDLSCWMCEKPERQCPLNYTMGYIYVVGIVLQLLKFLKNQNLLQTTVNMCKTDHNNSG